MNWLQKIAMPIFSLQQFEDMAQRVFNRNREYLKEEGITNWRTWVTEGDPYSLSLVFESDYDIYDRYLRSLPEETRAIDLIKMYQQGQLPNYEQPLYKYQPGEIESIDVGKRLLPWQKQNPELLTAEQSRQLYEMAIQRLTPSNRSTVIEARKNLYIAHNADPGFIEKVGITQTELNKKMRTMAGLRVAARRKEEQINNNIPEEHQWVGITNSTFMGRQQMSHDDLDKFVKNIDVTKHGKGFYGSNGGTALRGYIITTFLAIDTRLQYDDLSFEIGKCKKTTANGEYSNSQKKITISDMSPNTVAHEIGHYLDYKFSEAYGDKINSLSRSIMVSSTNPGITHLNLPIPQLKWADKYKEFVQNLMDKSDIWSEYTQGASEVFSRFIDKFVGWVSKQSNNYYHRDLLTERNDRFTEQDYITFIKLMQEKSYLDAKFPLPGIRE